MSVTVEQQRARFALDRWKQWSRKPAQRKELKALVQGAGVYMRRCGMIQSLAVWQGNTAGKLLNRALVDWLFNADCPVREIVTLDDQGNSRDKADQIISWCVGAVRHQYRSVEAELLALLPILKLMAPDLKPKATETMAAVSEANSDT